MRESYSLSVRKTSENERALVIKWSKDGKSLREIASLIGKRHGCIQKILQKYRRSGCVATIPGRGRKEILSATAMRKISKENSTVKRPETCIIDIIRNWEKNFRRNCRTCSS
ncbi:uncharacterized protein TNCV_2804901 [Trichonephila clavipes]|nr:uncharacterized protein TNCV_2804901 [Trichonephila clavipes]